MEAKPEVEGRRPELVVNSEAGVADVNSEMEVRRTREEEEEEEEEGEEEEEDGESQTRVDSGVAGDGFE